jgi:hypothetical protein
MSANVSSTSAKRAQDQPDSAESMARRLDAPVKRTTGLSLFHWLTIGSIGASVALFLAGKKNLAIFIGLWPPTFQALKAASESKQSGEH